MNPLDVVLKELNTGGVSVEVKRQRPDGRLESTRPNELATLGTKAKLANTANLLNKLSVEERLVWALEMKNHGNEFYSQQKYFEAMNTYVEALTASSFGGSINKDGPDGNVDCMVIPVLCNLSACCIQLNEWSKAIQFSQQAIDLRPNCLKAQLRKGVALLKINEYSDAMACFRVCTDAQQQHQQQKNNTTEPAAASDKNDENEEFSASADIICGDQTSVHLSVVESGSSLSRPGEEGAETKQLSLSEADLAKLPSLIRLARLGLQRERQQSKVQKAALMKAFHHTPAAAHQGTAATDNFAPRQMADIPPQKVEPMSITELLVFLVETLFEALMALLLRAYRALTEARSKATKAE